MIYRAGIVGCGRIGSLYDADSDGKNIYTHAGAYKANPNTELVTACDIDSEKLKKFSEMWKVDPMHLYQNYKDMLSNEDIDILSVCTLPDSHYEITKYAVENGVKIIFCEKPISDKVKNAKKIVELCKKEGVTLAVNHIRRWYKSHQKVKALIDDGGIGMVQHVYCNYTRGIRNYGTHIIDLVRYLFGEIEWLWAYDSLNEKENDKTLDAFLFFKKGFSCILNGYDRRYIDIFELEIYGTKGKISIKNFGEDIDIYKIVRHPVFKDSLILKKEDINFGKGGIGVAMVDAVYDLIDSYSNNKTPMCSGDDGLKSLEIINAIENSAKKRGRKIKLMS